MPIHDWTRVDAGIFHHFHQAWISEIAGRFNDGLLPSTYYALAEQVGCERRLGVFTLPSPLPRAEPVNEVELYAAKCNTVIIRQVSGHSAVAALEVVSPGNKSSRLRARAFVDRAINLVRAGVHLLVIDLLPPGLEDSKGIPELIRRELCGDTFGSLPGKPFVLASYTGDGAFVNFVGVGASLPDMPLFLMPDHYVQVPLEATFQTAWQGMPTFWRDVLSRG